MDAITATDKDAAADAIWADRCSVLYRAWVQLRYHRKRQRFFDLADKITKSATVLLGATLFGQTLKDKLPYVAGAISGLALLALIFGYGDRKQLHKELAEQAAALIGDIELVPAGALNAGVVAKWRSDHARLCAKAPPPLKTLTIMCEREQSMADGHPNHVLQLGLWRRWTSHFISGDGS